MELHEKLDTLTNTQDAEKERIREIIMNEGSRTKEIQVGGQSIRIRATIPREIRHDVQAYETEDTDDVNKTEAALYSLIAKMCVDAPFSNPDTWKLIDEETGIAIEVFTAVFKEASDTEAAIKRFRRK